MSGVVRLGVVAVVGVVVGFGFAVWAPSDRVQGDYVRIMFVHVPSAWLAFLAFGVTLVGSVGWLVRRRLWWDRLAGASAGVGVVFTGLALVTGMLWGRPVWGTFWDWGDARMMTTAIMFFVYLGYLALRRSVVDPVARARRSAVVGVVAFVQVPVVHFSVLWWRTLHQQATIIRPEPSIDGRMLTALLVNLAAFTVVYVVLMMVRMRVAVLEEAVEAVGVELMVPAGAAVEAPDVGRVRGV